MALVATQLDEVTIDDLDLEPAVALAQDARGRMPLARLHHGGHVGHVSHVTAP